MSKPRFEVHFGPRSGATYIRDNVTGELLETHEEIAAHMNKLISPPPPPNTQHPGWAGAGRRVDVEL